MIIYKTINLINNKIYVGKDKYNNPNYYGSGLLLNRAIKKYGKESFKKEIIEYCTSEQELNNKEIYWINQLNSFDKHIGYNISTGGLGGDNYTNNPNKHLIQEKLKISNKNKCRGRKLLKETINKILKNRNHKGEKNPFFNKKHTEETKQKLKQVEKTDDWKKKISNAIKQKNLTMGEEIRREYYSRNFNQNQTNQKRKGIKFNSKSKKIYGIYGELIKNLHQNKISYSEIAKIISSKMNINIGWWVIKTIINKHVAIE